MLVLTLILGTMSLRSVQAQTPTVAERKELLEVRRLVWDSYFNNDQGQLKRLIGDDFLTINPGEEHWQSKQSSWPERTLLQSIKASSCLWLFRRPRFKSSEVWPSFTP